MAIFSGTMMDDILMGTMDDDVLWGGMGDDRLSGGAGDDRLIGGPGADALNGGPGMDVASYTMSPAGVYINFGNLFIDTDDERPPVRGGDAEGDTLTSIEVIWGSDFADELIGAHGSDYFFGNGGDDQLVGHLGNDMLRGGADSDLLGDAMYEEGDDVLYGDGDDDTLLGGPGDDTLFGGEHDDSLEGNAGDDWLEGGPGADMHFGGEHDVMGDTVSYSMSPEPVTIRLYAGLIPNPDLDDPLQVLAAGGDAEGDDYEGIENVRGSAHDDILIGGAGEGNRIWGQQGDDLIIGLEEYPPGTPVTSADRFYGGKGDDTLRGGGGNDRLDGELGDDVLEGGPGNDILMGSPGMDMLYGGVLDVNGEHEDEGIDTANYSDSMEGVQIDLSTETPTGESMPTAMGGYAEGDVLDGIENITGTDYTDMLVGDDMDNFLDGGRGDDWDDPATPRVTEGGLFGGAGSDTLEGGSGDDWLDADGGDDSTDEVNYIKGERGNDMLIGGAGDDMTPMMDTTDDMTDDMADAMTMMGGLYGGPGNDTLVGGMGADMLDGGSGNDTADYSDSEMDVGGTEMGVTVNLGADFALVDDDGTDTTDDQGESVMGRADQGDAEGDMLVSIENVIGSEDGNNYLTGDRHNNMLEGGDGETSGAATITREDGAITPTSMNAFDDVLDGGRGSDVLMGGEGGDLLTGGTGSDIFVFGEQEDDDNDYISDFSKSEEDQIDLSELGLTENELREVLRAATVAATGNVITLDLTGHDGGMLHVEMTDRFTSLTVDDFIM